jgi:hypothetical protein
MSRSIAPAVRTLVRAALALAVTLPVAATTASAQVLFDNGPLVTNPGGGNGGRDLSRLQSNLGLSLFGTSANVNAPPPGPFRVADDFTVGGQGWNVNGFRFFGYQTGSTTTSTFNFLSVAIWRGRPGAVGSTIVFGDTTTNRLASTGFSNIFRALDTSPLDAQRPIMFLDANATFTLTPGQYWIDWGLGGTLGSGPWVPPVSIVGQTTTGNAIQRQATGWVDVVDAGANNAPQGLPFIIRGTPLQNVVPEPSTYVLMATGLGALGMMARRRQAKQG